MTKEQIQALIDAKIAGQGTAVDAGSVLPSILGGILEIIPDNADDILKKLSVKTDLTELQMIGASGTGLTKAAACQALGISVKDLDALMNGTAIRFEYGGGSLTVVSQTPARIVIGDVSAFSIVIGYDAAEGTYSVLASVNNVEFVKVTVTTDDETTAAGQIVTINDVNYTVGESGIVIAQVPYGTNYSVSANEKESYKTPSTQSFVAGQPFRTVTMEYKFKLEGVFIHYTDGTVSPYGTLLPEKTPDGVLLANDYVSFIIHPDEGENKSWSDNISTEIPGVTTTTDLDTAKADYAGEANTAAVIASGLAGSAFTFATERNGYLPSCGEMEQIRQNEANINAAMELIGGDSFSFASVIYWASTQYDGSSAWKWIGELNKFGAQAKPGSTGNTHCRAVRKY